MTLSLRWQRAAMLGSLWAANEIVLGSFLHNIGIPFAGTVLAAIAVALLVAGFTVWRDAGILWRAGVVCSLMKSISPSAVILGPMIGIMLEAVVVFVIIAGLRGTIAGCIAGGMVATVTPIIQKIINILFTYGMDMAEMYASLFTVTTQRLGVDGPDPARTLLWFIALQALPGAVAAIAGIAIGRGALAARREDILPLGDAGDATDFLQGSGDRYSIPVLFIHVLTLIVGLLLLPFVPRLLSPLPVALYLAAILYHYPVLRPRFRRVRLWVEFGVVALLAGILLGILAPGGNGTWWTGLTSGIVMTARATLVVAAFSAISIELRNPVILEWFFRRGLGTPSIAMRMAFRALPAIVQALSQQRDGLRHPIRTMSRMLASVLVRLHDGLPSAGRATVFIVSGDQGAGKTTLLADIVRMLRSENVTVRGFLSHVVYDGDERTGGHTEIPGSSERFPHVARDADERTGYDLEIPGSSERFPHVARDADKRTGYDLEILESGERLPLCRRTGGTGGVSVGPFTFTSAGLAAGMDALKTDADRSGQVIVVDEVGPLEMKDKGWASALPHLIAHEGAIVLLAVRPSLLPAVQEKWVFTAHTVWMVDGAVSGSSHEISRTILGTLSTSVTPSKV